MTPTRREVLLAMAAAACGRQPPEEGPASPDFVLGVASGDVTDTTALLWGVTALDGPGSVRIWPRGDEARVRTLATRANDAGVLSVDCAELSASTWYEFVFEIGSSRSDVGRFRTAPAADALEPLTFGVVSCARQTESLAPLLRAATDYQLDAMLGLGDAVYADGAFSLPEYRAKWRGALSRRPNRLVRGSTSTIATWDDHEVLNDVAGDRVDAAQLAAARAAFFEHQPVRTQGDRIWRSLKWGHSAEIFVLDCRSERNHATGEYISRAQLEWLKDGLASSKAVFKLVMNSVPISSYPGALFAAFAGDRWQGWPAQREELVRFVDEHTSGVLWLSGDFHMGVVGRVSLTSPGQRQLEVTAGPAGASLANPALSYPGPPQFDFASATHNFVVLDLNPGSREAGVRFVAGDGRVIFKQTYTL